jgi:hypothetical protein
MIRAPAQAAAGGRLVHFSLPAIYGSVHDKRCLQIQKPKAKQSHRHSQSDSRGRWLNPQGALGALSDHVIVGDAPMTEVVGALGI